MICLCTHGHPACAQPSVSRLRLQKYGFFQYNPRKTPSPTNPKNASCYQSAACVKDNSYQNSEGHYLLKTPIRLPKDIRLIHIIIFFISTQSLQSVLLYYITTISIFFLQTPFYLIFSLYLCAQILQYVSSFSRIHKSSRD